MDERFLEYNVIDSCVTLQCRNEFWHEIQEQGYLPTYQMTTRLFEPLMFMQTRGLRINREALDETKGDILRTIEEKKEELNRVANRPLNALSPKDVQTYFYIEKGCAPYTNKEGKITTDDSALQRLAKPTRQRPGFREAKIIQEIRGLNKLYSSYLDVSVDADSRLRCSWNPRGTKFGRLSSSETVFGTGLNLQNLHPQFKKFIQADEGYFFVEVDKRQAEWVIVAYLTQDANMLQVVEEGKDPHVFTGSLIFNVPEDIIRYDNKVVGHESDPSTILALRQADPILLPYLDRLPRFMSGRQVGKHANHGLNYDEGYVTFALTWELDQSFAKWVVEMYHRVYPCIRMWYKDIQRQLGEDRTLINCFGRKLHFLDQWGDDLFKAAYSALPQSTNVDGLNKGMCEIYEHPWICNVRGANLDLMAQVHDSLLLQIPLRNLEESGRISEIMGSIYDLVSPTMEYHGRQFKLKSDMKVGWNWGARHAGLNARGMEEVKAHPGDSKFEDEIRGILGVAQRAE